MPESQQPQDGIKVVLDLIMENPTVNVIDVGAGEGKWGKLLKGRVPRIDGIEVWTPYISKYNLIPCYDELFNIDMTLFNYPRKYDVMILGDVLEHLTYQKAIEFINKAKENVDKIYLIIPTSLCIQDGSYYGNPYESHLYQWTDKELRDLFNFELLHSGYNPNGLVQIGTYIWKK